MATKKAIFIDRGGVIHREFGKGITGKPNELVIENKVITALKSVDHERFQVFFVDHADPVAFGVYSQRAYEKLTQRLLRILKRNHITVDGFYTSFYHPQGEGKYRRESVFCYPNVGLFKLPQQEHELDLRASWFVGDRTREILAAQRAEMQTMLVRTGAAGQDREYYVEPDFVADDLLQAVRVIHGQEVTLIR